MRTNSKEVDSYFSRQSFIKKVKYGNPVHLYFCLEKGKKIGRFLDAKNLSAWPKDDGRGFCFGINNQHNENHHNVKIAWQIQFLL